MNVYWKDIQGRLCKIYANTPNHKDAIDAVEEHLYDNNVYGVFPILAVIPKATV